MSEEGPRTERLDGPVDDAELTEAIHLVYCPNEDRNIEVVYHAIDDLPECPNCEINFDVAAFPPEGRGPFRRFDFLRRAHFDSSKSVRLMSEWKITPVRIFRSRALD